RQGGQDRLGRRDPLPDTLPLPPGRAARSAGRRAAERPGRPGLRRDRQFRRLRPGGPVGPGERGATPTLTPIRRRTAILTDTLGAIEVVTDTAEETVAPAIERAFDWFRQVEERCTRFDPDSEVMALATKVGTPVPVSPILFETARFALAVARASGGAFDPTIGQELAARGFDRNYRTGERVTA